MSTRPYHHGDLRRTLLTSAAHTIEEVGVDALSLRQLARDAGVSHAAPGRHFRDKQALLDDLAEDGFNRLAAALQHAVADEPRSPSEAMEQFHALARAYIAFAQAQPTLLTLMFSMKHSPDARTELLEAGQTSMRITTNAVVDMQEVGAITPGDPARIATVLFSIVHGVATLISAGFLEESSAETLIDDALATTWQGLQPHATKS